MGWLRDGNYRGDQAVVVHGILELRFAVDESDTLEAFPTVKPMGENRELQEGILKSRKNKNS